MISKPTNRIVFYKLTVDSGGAPCIKRKVLSLAICKRAIRRNANPGDIIFGFGRKKMNEKLIYIAKVTKVERDGDYYSDKNRYQYREDCIYEFKGNVLHYKKDSLYHSEQDRDHDVGRPGDHRENANVILSNDFVYFGNSDYTAYKGKYDLVKNSIENLGPGHRVYHDTNLKDQLLDLMNSLWKKHSITSSKPAILGFPTDEKSKVKCSKSEGPVEIQEYTCR